MKWIFSGCVAGAVIGWLICWLMDLLPQPWRLAIFGVVYGVMIASIFWYLLACWAVRQEFHARLDLNDRWAKFHVQQINLLQAMWVEYVNSIPESSPKPEPDPADWWKNGLSLEND